MSAEQLDRTAFTLTEEKIDGELEAWRKNFEKILEYQSTSEKMNDPIGRRIIIPGSSGDNPTGGVPENVGIIISNGGAENEHLVLFVDGSALLLERKDTNFVLDKEFGPNKEPRMFNRDPALVGQTSKDVIGKIKGELLSQENIKVTPILSSTIAERSFGRAADVIGEGLKRVTDHVQVITVFNAKFGPLTRVQNQAN